MKYLVPTSRWLPETIPMVSPAWAPQRSRAMVRAMGIQGIVVQGMWEGQGEL
jgi:predicted transcriptional regulator